MLESEAAPTPSHLSNFSRSSDVANEESNDITMTISAPGKVILYGEHSVVYGKLAVAASLGLRTKLFLTENEIKTDQSNYVKVELPNISLVHVYDLKDLQHSLLAPVLPLCKSPSNYNWKKPNLINHDELLNIVADYVTRSAGSLPLTRQQNLSLRALFYLLTGILASANVELKPFTLRIETELSLSSGSGSSASYSVVLAACFIHYLRIIMSRRKIEDVSKSGYKSTKMLTFDLKYFTEDELEIVSKWAYLSEKIMHGSPSGIDNSVCTYGSIVEFRKMTGAKRVQFNGKLKLLLINTNVKRDTKRLVNNTAILKERFPTIIEPIFEAMDEIARKGEECLISLNGSCTNVQEVEKSFRKLGELTDINQHLLQALGASHPTLDQICTIVKRFGLCAKLTGAGGGGYAIVLIPPYVTNAVIDQLSQKLTAEGFQATTTNLAGAGVTIDFCNMNQDTL